MPANNQALPRVAVIIPCFNHGEYVKDAIESVVEQDYPMKSIFLSDEGSSDNSWEVATSLVEGVNTVEHPTEEIIAGTIKNVPIIFTKNPNPNGPSAARNRLMQMAWKSADAFSMLDADDLYLPGKLGKSVQTMFEHPEMIGLVYTDAIIFHEKKCLNIREYREPYVRWRLEQECIISNTPLVSQVAIRDVGGYDESMRTAEDWDLWLRITSKYVAVHIPEALHVYRVTGKNASNVVPQEVWQQNWQKIRDRLNGTRN